MQVSRNFRHFSVVPALLVALTMLAPELAAAPSADEAKELREAQAALAAIAKKHREAKTFSLVFESSAEGADGNPLPPVRGSLLASDSGRFRLEHARGTVISDGKTVWQHFPSTRQVVVRDASEASEAGGVLLRFLQARALKAEKRGGRMRVALDPASVGESLDSLVVTLSPDASTVTKVETQDPAGNRVEYAMKSMRYDARASREMFTFKKPAGVEVIDMR
jgi:outer membrane lipoprotein-sorting protein